jgi:sucrose-6-phosphate hydrolase SacC (GH32 family)
VSNFHQGFAALPTAPRFVADAEMDLSVLIDKTSVELFADGGRTVMTALFFPTHPFTNCSLQSKEGISVKTINLFLFK